MAREKKNADAPGTPKKTRWYHNVAQAYKIAYQADKFLPVWLAAAFLGTLAVFLVVGVLTGWIGYFIFLGILFALLPTMYLLARKAESAAYARIEGTPGSAISALQTIRRGWSFSDEPVAIDPRTQDMVFRGVGRPGVVLVSQGPPHRVAKLLENERKRIARVLPAVPIILIQEGREEGQVPLPKLSSAVRKQKGRLNKHELSQVHKRLTALGAAKLPIPKGVDPFKVRPDRKGMRGR